MIRRPSIIKLCCLLLSPFLLLLSYQQVSGEEGKTEPKKILSFGGNGFIGGQVLTRLIKEGSYDITLVSRGSWDFDYEETIRPHVRSFVCDREMFGEPNRWVNALRQCSELINYIKDTDEYHAVLDFSGYNPRAVMDLLDVLKGKNVRVYVYISTDSVYEVSEMPSIAVGDGERRRRSLETDAKRPENEVLRKKFREKDTYGDEKLACEELLVEQRRNGTVNSDDSPLGFPYALMRFADVIGPRDSTARWATYQMAVKFHRDVRVPLTVSESISDVVASVTYVEDAALAILSTMQRPDSWDEAYNIACEEESSATLLFKLIARSMGQSDVNVEVVDDDESNFDMFPSVYNGPMDISKAKKRLDFVPTPLDVAIRKTVEWYDMMFLTDEAERDSMLAEFENDILDEDDKSMMKRLDKAVRREIDSDEEDNDEEDLEDDEEVEEDDLDDDDDPEEEDELEERDEEEGQVDEDSEEEETEDDLGVLLDAMIDGEL